MKYSQMLENLLSPYDIEVIRRFCDSSNVYLFIDTNFPHSKNTLITAFTENDGEQYFFKDPKTFYFHLPEEKLYGGGGYALVVFKHSEEEIINKFYRFMKMRAFL